ncbi:MAG: hypothetical protein DCC54_14275 [Anaerolineae bacterium]|nr:MAG: hypothetical protein DCC54_14275 [Anaerolineae bacterium]
MARRMNLAVSVGDLRVERIFADKELAAALNVPLASHLTRVRRVMQADARPVAFLVDTLPETVLHADDLPESFSGSVLDFLLGRADPPVSSRAAVSAIDASPDVARTLQIQRGDVLLHFNALSYFIPGYFNFHIVRRIKNS